MLRFPLAIVVLALGLGAAAPAAGPPLPLIKPGVRVLGLRVAGMTSEQARAKLRASFARPVRFRLGDRTWQARPSELGAAADIDGAVARALAAPPRARVPLHVSIWKVRLRTYVARLDKKYSYPAKDAQLIGLSNLQPLISDSKPGRKVDSRALASSIVRAVRSGSRPVVPVPQRVVQPKVTAASFTSIIVINRGGESLMLYDGTSLMRSFQVATGQSAYPTPAGEWSIVTMQRDPWWYPPQTSAWAKGLKPVPPGPGNPLGTRWMGLSAAGVGIHGTPDAASIGYSASHGCIRMYVPDAEWLFERVHVGTPVFIV